MDGLDMLRVTETLATIAAMAAFSAVTFLWRVRTNTAATVLAPDLGKICLTQRSVMKTEAQPVTRRQRLVHGLKEYAAISIYLYVVFGALLLYKTSTLQAYGDDYTPYGLAAVKALILAKFMLVAHEMHLGERHRNKSLVYKILYRSIIFLVMLVALTYVEEAVSGVIHGRTAAQSISEVAGGTWLQLVATCLLLWLILLPYFGFREISAALGEGELRRMLFGKR
jgi:hypothetical protein